MNTPEVLPRPPLEDEPDEFVDPPELYQCKFCGKTDADPVNLCEPIKLA